MRSLRLMFTLLGLVAFVSSLPLYAQREKLSSEDLAIVNKKWPNAKKTVTGLRYVMNEEGKGDLVKSGDVVHVLYRASLLSNGTVFNECVDPNDSFSFRVDRGLVIEAWDQAMKLMREGGKMVLIVPYELGYGTRGNPPRVPRQASLVFEINLLKIEHTVPIASQFKPNEPDKNAKKH